VVWSAAQGAFLYTAPSHPGRFGASDIFAYEIVDDTGATARATVSINLVDPASPT
jgi:hypothetical protein